MGAGSGELGFVLGEAPPPHGPRDAEADHEERHEPKVDDVGEADEGRARIEVLHLRQARVAGSPRLDGDEVVAGG